MFLHESYYLPFEKRVPDQQYKNLLKDVLKNGHFRDTVQGPRALTLLGPCPMRFDLRNGIPLITERNLNIKPRDQPRLWQQAIGELIAFLHGARRLTEIEQYGCLWWTKWVAQEGRNWFGLPYGDLGDGFYGEAFTKFPIGNGKTFDQVSAVIRQISKNPNTRTHFISPWIPHLVIGDTRKTMTTPCTGWMYFEVNGKNLSLVMTQRAGDIPIGIPFNLFQYATFLVMVSFVTNLVPNEFVHMIMDAHIYENQLDAVKILLKEPNKPFPTLIVNKDVENIFDFRYEDFILRDYSSGPKIEIPVTI